MNRAKFLRFLVWLSVEVHNCPLEKFICDEILPIINQYKKRNQSIKERMEPVKFML